MENKHSVLIQGQLQDARTRLAETDARIAALEEEVRVKTAADDFDFGGKDVTRLMGEQSKLTQERKVIEFRIDSLVQKHVVALQDEARARLTTLAQAASEEVAAASTTAKHWQRTIEELHRLCEEVRAHSARYAHLMGEARYLATLLNSNAPEFASFPMPQVTEVEALKRNVEASTRFPSSSWEQKRQRLIEQRSKEEGSQSSLQPIAHVSYDPTVLSQARDEREQRTGILSRLRGE